MSATEMVLPTTPTTVPRTPILPRAMPTPTPSVTHATTAWPSRMHRNLAFDVYQHLYAHLQTIPAVDSAQYAHCIEVSRRVRWDIDEDVIRGRELDCRDYYLLHPLSRVDELTFLSTEEQKFLSQIQGCSYANIFGLVERFINCKNRPGPYWHSPAILSSSPRPTMSSALTPLIQYRPCLRTYSCTTGRRSPSMPSWMN